MVSLAVWVFEYVQMYFLILYIFLSCFIQIPASYLYRGSTMTYLYVKTLHWVGEIKQ